MHILCSLLHIKECPDFLKYIKSLTWVWSVLSYIESSYVNQHEYDRSLVYNLSPFLMNGPRPVLSRSKTLLAQANPFCGYRIYLKGLRAKGFSLMSWMGIVAWLLLRQFREVGTTCRHFRGKLEAHSCSWIWPPVKGCQIFLGSWHQNQKKCTKWTQKVPNCHKISHMSVKYSKCP
jgi:hypothetical protein